MKFIVALFGLLCFSKISAQPPSHFDERWAFTGLRTTVFRVENGDLYVGMLEYADTSNFARLLRKEP
jgi:hypothetical protein